MSKSAVARRGKFNVNFRTPAHGHDAFIRMISSASFLRTLRDGVAAGDTRALNAEYDLGYIRVGQSDHVILFLQSPENLSENPRRDILQFANGCVIDMNNGHIAAMPAPCMISMDTGSADLTAAIDNIAAGEDYQLTLGYDGTVLNIYRHPLTSEVMIATRRSGDAANDDRGVGKYNDLFNNALSVYGMSRAAFNREIAAGYTYTFVLTNPQLHLTTPKEGLVLLRVTENATGMYSEAVLIGNIPTQVQWSAKNLRALIRETLRSTAAMIKYNVSSDPELKSDPAAGKALVPAEKLNELQTQVINELTSNQTAIFKTAHGVENEDLSQKEKRPTTYPYVIVIHRIGGTVGFWRSPFATIAHGVYMLRPIANIPPVESQVISVLTGTQIRSMCTYCFPPFGKKIRQAMAIVRAVAQTVANKMSKEQLTRKLVEFVYEKMPRRQLDANVDAMQRATGINLGLVSAAYNTLRLQYISESHGGKMNMNALVLALMAEPSITLFLHPQLMLRDPSEWSQSYVTHHTGLLAVLGATVSPNDAAIEEITAGAVVAGSATGAAGSAPAPALGGAKA